MYYEINVAKNGKHFFATSERSITNEGKLKEVYKELKRAFPEEQGYSINVSQNPQVWHGVNMDEIS